MKKAEHAKLLLLLFQCRNIILYSWQNKGTLFPRRASRLFLTASQFICISLVFFRSRSFVSIARSYLIKSIDDDRFLLWIFSSVVVMDFSMGIKEASAYAHYSVLRSIRALTFLYSYISVLLHTLRVFVLHFKCHHALCFILFFSRLLYYKTVKFNERNS